MGRYEQLDSLRGLAALTVMAGHFLYLFPNMLVTYRGTDGIGLFLIKYTPLHLFWAGHEAVILFFILSGFVLSLPFHSKRTNDYFPFLIKRICRIYIPFIVSVLFALLVKSLVFDPGLITASSWINGIWGLPSTAASIWQHFLLIGSLRSELNPVLWTLVHEMRISLIFPFIMVFILRAGWKTSLIAGFLLSCTGVLLYQIMDADYNANPYLSLHYTFMFMVGALLAQHIHLIRDRMSKLTPLRKLFLLLAGILAYTYSFLFHDIRLIHNTALNDWAITIGASVFILFAIGSESTAKRLRKRIFVFFGKISYSLYLYHTIVLLAATHILYDKTSEWVILLISLLGTLLFAVISYYFVEVTSIKLGKKLLSFNWSRDGQVNAELNK